MVGKIILYIVGALFIIPGLAGIISGLVTPSNYGNIGAFRLGYGFLFFAIGCILVWLGRMIKRKKV
ncbi:MAG: hypothetical protein ACR2IL_01335 [Chitinophagaceae bacterium]